MIISLALISSTNLWMLIGTWTSFKMISSDRSKTSTWNLGKTSFTYKMELLLIEPELLQRIWTSIFRTSGSEMEVLMYNCLQGLPILFPSIFIYGVIWKLVYRTSIESRDQLVQQMRDMCDTVRADVNTIQIATNAVVRCSELCYDNQVGISKIFCSVFIIYEKRT